MDKEKQNKLEKLRDKINKKYDTNALSLGSDLTDYETIPTPFASLNALIKGLPRGRFSIVAG